MPRKIAVKVDIDTLRGYREGVPRLLDLFGRKNIKATLFFSFGPDNSGKAIRRIFRKGFIAKMIRTKAPSTYGLKTLLYGTVLPAPMIVAPAPQAFLRALHEGHECGIHCWDHAFWQDKLPGMSEEVVRGEFDKAIAMFENFAHRRPLCCAAPGWQVTPRSLKVQQSLGFTYCSDVRGVSPFEPKMAGVCYQPPQVPGTLLTMDECLGLPGITARTIADYWLKNCDKDWNVLTIHAEMEGMAQLPLLEEFITKAQQSGYAFVCLKEGVRLARGNVCEVYHGALPGRAGTVALQGEAAL